MNQQEIYELCKRAFVENQIGALLRGDEPFTCAPGAGVPGLVPTDWESLLRTGIIPLCQADQTGVLAGQLRREMRLLLQGDVIDVWCVYNVYFYACYIEKDSQVKLRLADEAFRMQLQQAIYRRESQLKACRLWQGKFDPEGLWGDISHADQALQRRFQMGVL